MTNPYYTPTGNPISLTRGTSALVRAEFTNIQTGFDAAYAATLLRGLKTGDTWTGTHDFTGATVNLGSASFSASPTVPTPGASDNSTNAVNSAWVVTYVTGVAFSGVLPNQAANADKLVTTNGTTASWTALLKASVIRFKDGTDASKLLAFSLSGLTTATTRTVTIPDKNGTMAMTSDLVLTAAFLSADQTITSAGALTIAHSLGSIPKIVMGYIKCVTGENGYSAGDVLAVPLGQDGSSTAVGVSIVPDATNLNVRFGGNASAFGILNKSNGTGAAITNANWTFHMRAFA